MLKQIKIRNAIILILCIILEVGCATFRSKEKTDDFFYRASDVIEKRCAYWQSFEAQFSLKVNAPRDPNRYILLYYQNHEFLRLDLISLWGNTIAVIVVKPKEATIWIPAKKTLYKASNVGNLLEKLAGIEGRIIDVLPVVTGCISNQPGRSFRVLSTKSQGLDLEGLKIKQIDRIWQIDYSPPFSLSPAENLPKTIHIHTSDLDINLELQKINKRDLIPNSRFEVSYPQETSIIEL
ncbi:MAG: lipoprotein insertase outer membrane protein LolB [Thermodesulforhabdaceae bacterium]